MSYYNPVRFIFEPEARVSSAMQPATCIIFGFNGLAAQSWQN
jgi:hypothetical protein